jgi:hypothetical protein
MTRTSPPFSRRIPKLTNGQVPVNQESGGANKTETRRRQPNPLPLTDRLLVSLPEAAALMSVSTRTAKRVAVEHPELVCRVARRRMFILRQLQEFVASGGR